MPGRANAVTCSHAAWRLGRCACLRPLLQLCGHGLCRSARTKSPTRDSRQVPARGHCRHRQPQVRNLATCRGGSSGAHAVHARGLLAHWAASRAHVPTIAPMCAAARRCGRCGQRTRLSRPCRPGRWTRSCLPLRWYPLTAPSRPATHGACARWSSSRRRRAAAQVGLRAARASLRARGRSCQRVALPSPRSAAGAVNVVAKTGQTTVIVRDAFMVPLLEVELGSGEGAEGWCMARCICSGAGGHKLQPPRCAVLNWLAPCCARSRRRHPRPKQPSGAGLPGFQVGGVELQRRG